MNYQRVYFVFVTLLSVFVLPFTVENVMGAERAKYDVLKRDGNFELRRYESHIVAETMVEGDFESVGNEGFRRLFDYISGKNRKKQSLSMTAPVNQETKAEKIPMTAPVNQERVGGKYRITFLMPSEYAMETLPEPLDSRVELHEEPGRLMAAIKYSGTWGRSRYEKKKVRLLEWLEQNGLKPLGAAVFARYNPPFMPWFLRRNEILIPVEYGLRKNQSRNSSPS